MVSRAVGSLAISAQGVKSFVLREGDDALVVVEARDAQSSAARSLAEMAQGGPQSSGARFLARILRAGDAALVVGVDALEARVGAVELNRGSQSCGAQSLAGMMKTSIFALHETDRRSGRTNSTCVPKLTDREGFSRRLPSPPLLVLLRVKRDESLDTVLVLVLSVLVTRRGLGGICRNHATEGSMLWGVVG